MLILTRERDQSIVIGPDGPDQVTITVVDIRGGKIRLGIDAPKNVPVHRYEIAKAIRRELAKA